MGVAVLDDIEREHMALIESYQDRLNVLADEAAAMVRAAFLDLPAVRDALIAEFIREAEMIVAAARLEGADLATGLVSELAGEVPRVIDLRYDRPDFEAPFLRTWRRISQGDDFPSARMSGASQAEIIGHNAAHDGANARMRNTGLRVVGARRVVSANPCEWCQVVATQRYHSVEAADFGHGGHGDKRNCKCTVVGIYGNRDPGRVLNRTRLGELKASGAVKRVSAARARRR